MSFNKHMRCPSLKELPKTPRGKTGWPWDEETAQLSERLPDAQAWPRMSIVTPSYNQSRFLEETIRAVLLQGYPDLEYIIVDSSSDESMAIIERYAQWGKIIRCDARYGMSQAINRGFAVCTGDIITWISSDDVYLPGTLSRVGSSLWRQQDYGVIVGGFRFIDEESHIDSQVYLPRLPWPSPLDLTVMPPLAWRLHQVATFYTRKGLEAVGWRLREDLDSNMDRELLYRVVCRKKVLLVPECLALFRRHQASKSCAVSNILPMSREAAAVYLLFLNGNRKQDRARHAAARYFRANGYLTYAKYGQGFGKRIAALFTAGLYYPRFFLKKEYVRTWVKVLGVLGSFLRPKTTREGGAG